MKQLISILFLSIALMQTALAINKPLPLSLNTPINGKLSEDVVFNEETVYAMPAEIILNADNDCHIFGFVVLGEVNEGGERSALGIVKRLVCKNEEHEKGFSIWNVQGDFVPAKAASANAAEGVLAVEIPVERSQQDDKTIYTVKAGIELTVTATRIGTERFGSHIYLFGNNLTPKPFKIQLAQLPSFGGESLEEMPELAQ